MHSYSYLVLIFAVNIIVAVISWPVTTLIFSKLSDKGYSISSVVGIVSVSYLYFLFGTLFNLSTFFLVFSIFMWVSINLVISQKTGLPSLNIDLKQIFFINLSLFILMSFWFFIRSHNVQIHEIERPFDYGVLKALENAAKLPLMDSWFAGNTWNYYYFGHFIGHTMLKISRVPLSAGFFILVCWLYAVIGVNVFRIGRDLSAYILGSNKREITYRLAGLFSVVFYLFCGNLHSISLLHTKILGFFGNTTEPVSFWFSDATRFITGTITEMPFYAFLVSDLHAHVWGSLISLIIFTVIFLLFLNEEYKLDLKNKYLYLLSVLFGILFMTNSWDVFSLGILLYIVIIFKYKKEVVKALFSDVREITDTKRLLLIWKPVLILFLLPIMSLVISLPWLLYYKGAISGIGLVFSPTPLYEFMMQWGAFIVYVFLYLFISKRKHNQNQLIKIIVISSVLILAFIEVFFFKDILFNGEFYRANTVFKFTYQIWLWLSLISGSVIVYAIKNSKAVARSFIIPFFALIFVTQMSYPVLTINTLGLLSKNVQDISSGLNWWKEKYPYDYEAYTFLNDYVDKLPLEEKSKVVIEADGSSYSDNNIFSTFLGWQSVIGWPVHEWTWRGSYDEVGNRREDVRLVYLSNDVGKTKDILQKYNVDFIIIGEIEEEIYGEDDIKYEKLLSLGNVFFQNQQTTVIRISK